MKMSCKKTTKCMESVTTGPSDKGSLKKCSYNTGLKNISYEAPYSFPHTEVHPTNSSLYTFEMTCDTTSTATGPTFSFWTQPKSFDWNFGQSGRRNPYHGDKKFTFEDNQTHFKKL